ncbi:MAG TPA: polysaccharide biosynthesis/export family protein, partial [Pirellulaceae bacterium]|nr:polysaccharide biosynthesis/export family protein [Pirellulaceae bacterium]
MKSVLELPHEPLRRAIWLVITFVAASTMLGCTRTNLYQASSLPPELSAPRYATLQNVDLSRFARTIGNSQTLYPGDQLEVTVATGLEKNAVPAWKGRIAEDGTINVPLIGTVQVAGLELTQAEQAVRGESIRRGKFVNPNVSIVLDKRRTNSIAVVGAVENPGTYELPASSSDLLSAIAAAGDLAENAGTIVEIRHPPGFVETAMTGHGEGYSTELASLRGDRRLARTPPRTVQVDLTQAATSDYGDYSLADGATVMVMERPKRFIHVMGLVNNPSQFEIPEEQQEVSLLGAIAMAGGQTLSIADKVHVIRQLPDRTEPVVIQASVRAAKKDTTSNIRIAAGDIVSVEETPATFVLGTIK